MPFFVLLLAAQVAAAPPTAASPADDIVVTGSGEATQSKKLVYAGSRLARPPVQLSPYIASSTGFQGLTPDSGLDAFKGSRSVRTKRCVVTGATLSKAAACGLVPVQKALMASDLATAKTLAQGLLGLFGLTPTDIFVTHSFLYRIAETAGDRTGRRVALAAMVDSGLLNAADELAAIKTLASLALDADDRQSALRYYREARLLDGEDTRTLLNIAALLQSSGAKDEARGLVREAVAVVQRQGGAPPQAWLDNIR